MIDIIDYRCDDSLGMRVWKKIIKNMMKEKENVT